ncbi:MAG: hypothetical protein J0G98_09025 [Terrimonas ferruginea]|uniref:hypothetical protein n=1 Tax=Terrimonas ferruginea TaxID=249 RepID=UPI000B19AF2A|nr:hypothetical protein [Terrimonas ferruginea]MBN8783195.1 hypothetical protein [Terrimonas ferruginea]
MKQAVLMARAIVLPLLLISFATRVNSQNYSETSQWEVGIGLGPMVFLGDLGGSAGIGRSFVKDVDFPLIKLGKSIHVSYSPADFLAFRFALNQGVVEGNDAYAPNKGGPEVDRLQRNLSFKSNIWEAYLAAEVYPTVFIERYEGLAGKFRPYGVIGIGAFRFNPKAQLDGEWVELKPLRLEGQGMAEYPESKPYSLIQMEIPMGLGFKYYIKDNMYVGLEILHRKLFTDYVDDVSTGYIDPVHFSTYLSAQDAARANRLYYRGTYSSAVSNPGNIQTFQRGDPKDNDAFFTTLVRFGVQLNSQKGPGARARKQLRCPVYY